MDSLIAASARLLSVGDALGALRRVALRTDPPALALRGIAMAQLGEYEKARELLRTAGRNFGPHEDLARARCAVAEAEIALATRDLIHLPEMLDNALPALIAHSDYVNTLHARLIAIRRLVLLGRIDLAKDALANLDVRKTPPLLAAVVELIVADLALRSLQADAAHAALLQAHRAARRARTPALLAEVEKAQMAFEQPAARRVLHGGMQAMHLDEIAVLLASDTLVVDACRHRLGVGNEWRSLARRPVLFKLIHALAQAWPGDSSREQLMTSVFNTRHPNESHRARLRVEISRLRALIPTLAHIDATTKGFALNPIGRRPVVLLVPPFDDDLASLVALLSDGTAWSTASLALALGVSQRTIQRALGDLEAAGRVRAIGQARARRWVSPTLTEFTTILLLPSTLPMK